MLFLTPLSFKYHSHTQTVNLDSLDFINSVLLTNGVLLSKEISKLSPLPIKIGNISRLRTIPLFKYIYILKENYYLLNCIIFIFPLLM